MADCFVIFVHELHEFVICDAAYIVEEHDAAAEMESSKINVGANCGSPINVNYTASKLPRSGALRAP